jgi:UDP-N-acetylglucosamine 2-epimerase (non-hydrolysing)
MRLMHVVGARPNFMKAAPVIRALNRHPNVQQQLVHTGQHYDLNMSDVFFQQLRIPDPDFNLQVGSRSHAQQVAEIMLRFEAVVLQEKPDLVMVYGDVNSTIAAALVCAKLLIKIAHVEAGLRSFDRTMPEEVNRILTDQLADLLFTPSEDGNNNLAREGIAKQKVHLVGNVMIDTLLTMLPLAKHRLPDNLPDNYVLVTLHRPANVDDTDWLLAIIKVLHEVGTEIPVLFPVHPRTRQRLIGSAALEGGNGLRLLDPLPYLEFLGLQSRATAIVTDSGGIQEESTVLGIPCLTMRDNTERPITVTLGTNRLVGRSLERLRRELHRVLAGHVPAAKTPPLWDGKASERIADIVTRPPLTRRIVIPMSLPNAYVPIASAVPNRTGRPSASPV